MPHKVESNMVNSCYIIYTYLLIIWEWDDNRYLHPCLHRYLFVAIISRQFPNVHSRTQHQVESAVVNTCYTINTYLLIVWAWIYNQYLLSSGVNTIRQFILTHWWREHEKTIHTYILIVWAWQDNWHLHQCSHRYLFVPTITWQSPNGHTYTQHKAKSSMVNHSCITNTYLLMVWAWVENRYLPTNKTTRQCQWDH